MDDFAFSLDDLPPRINHPGAARRLTFDEVVKTIEVILETALPGTAAVRYRERKMEAVTWRRNARSATVRNVAPDVVAHAFGSPGDLRQFEPRPADADTITKLAWDIARHLAQT